MGPMGPMGPMMGGWWQGGSAGVWGWLALMVVLLVLAAAAGFVLWRASGPPSEHRPRSAEEILRERYARGELTRQRYQDALVDVLKDRYVRGEIDLDTYEARLERLFGMERPRHGPSIEDPRHVGLSEESPPGGSGPVEGGSP